MQRRTSRKRNWKEYNKKLIARGEFYVNPRFLDTWLEEIASMNAGKIGQPFLYPTSMIQFLAVLHAKGFDYRSLEGIMHAFSKRLGPFPVICYSQIRKRIIALDVSFTTRANDLVVGIDGTGLKVSNRGEWIRQQWAVRRGWVKVVLMGTTSGDIVDVIIGSETLNEQQVARDLIQQHLPNTALLDGLHDVIDTYDQCHAHGTTLVVPARTNASTKGLTPRGRAVRLQQQLGHKHWVKASRYGHRWPATEGVFSAVKRIFGEELTSHTESCLYHEARRKFWAYQQLRNLSVT